MAWKASEGSNYNFGRHLIPFMQDCPFYAEMSRHMQKRCTREMPTMAVGFDAKRDELVLWYNDVFMAGGEYTDASGALVTEDGLSNWEIRGGLTHEFDHVVYGHLNARRRDPSDIDNIAKDLAINWLIEQRQGQPRDVLPGQVERCLPRIGLVPGRRPWVDPTKLEKMSPERKKAVEHLSDVIEKFPGGKASEWYFNKLMEDKQKNPGMYPEGVTLVLGQDDHDEWDAVPDEIRDYVEGRVKAIIEKAVRHADSQDGGWGTIPMELREEIRRSISTIVNWRQVLRQFIGSLVRGHRTTTIKRINKRYPYIHPGIKRGYTAKLLIALDESASVDNEMLEMFFAELDKLTRKVDITICHFDCDCSEKDLYEWRKGTRPMLKRERSGGTNFDAPTKIFNDPRNRGRWDGLLIMTDGGAPAPSPCRGKRGWVLGQGCNLIFPSDEIQIFLSKDTQVRGAWK